MSQIEQIVKQIQAEFRIDEAGQAFVTIRGAARLPRNTEEQTQRLSQLAQNCLTVNSKFGVNKMNKLLYSQWDGNPPQVLAISQPMPEAPYLPLTGGGTARMSLDSYIRDLKRDFERECGEYFAYVWGYYESGDEADMYTLQTWQVCPPTDGTYEAVVVLYYAPANPYLTLKKHMGESMAQEYLDRNAALSAIADALHVPRLASRKSGIVGGNPTT